MTKHGNKDSQSRNRILIQVCLLTAIALAAMTLAPLTAFAAGSAEKEMLELLREDRPFTSIPQDLFDRLGWDLPDNGTQIKALADAAPGSAFDPRKLETLDADKLGYRAKWHEVRYKFYGLDWDIGGLHLTPNDPLPGAPTVAIIHGGSANWYWFLMTPLNEPGLAQYLAQKVPVLLITIPGNYKHGGWTRTSYGERVPAYLLDRELSPEEGKIRNAIYTFRLVAEGVRQLVEKTTSGTVLMVGHSTGGEIRFLLEESSLKARMAGLSLGWASGGPARLHIMGDDAEQVRARLKERFQDALPVWQLRARHPASYSHYVGPLNPVEGDTKEDVAHNLFRMIGRWRPFFKQTLQDLEHTGADIYRDRTANQIVQALEGNRLGVDPNEVIQDLFSTMQSPLTGYRKMIWTVGRNDDGHWSADDPMQSRELRFADAFRRQNPNIPVRVAVFDLPMTHIGHIEKPRQLAGGLVTAVQWLMEP
ncbi:MAG: alpha/beta fold hydrolase [Acidobacteriota bacterium]